MSGLKYSAGTITPINTLRLEDFLYTNNPGGPTNVSGYYNSRPVPTNGYVIYIDKVSGGPSTYVLQNDTELIELSKIISNQNLTTVQECISYFQSNSNMVLFYGEVPDIILDGLQYYVDAGVLQSYPRTGTTWTDLTYSGNNGTLINGTSFSGSNYGSLVFDGIDDGIFLSSTPITISSEFQPWTLSFWVNKGNINTITSINQTYINDSFSGSGSYSDQFTVSNLIYTITKDANNKILIGGTFIEYSGNPCAKIARLNSDGTYDSTFNGGLGFDKPSAVNKILVSSTGKIYVVGTFTSYSGVTANEIIRLNEDGSIDTTFSAGTGFNSAVYDIVEDSSGNLYVGGYFTTYKGSSNVKIIKLDSSGNKINSFDNTTGFRVGTSTSTSFGVNSLSLSPDETKLYCGGSFTTYKSPTVNANRIARLNTSDGSLDTSFDMTVGFDSTVLKIYSSNSGVFVGGSFASALNNTRNRFVKLTTGGTIDNTFQVGTGFNNNVNDISEDQNGKIYVGGVFSVYSGQTNRDIIRLNSDGFKDATFVNVPSTNLSVYGLYVDGSDVYIGGDFWTYKGVFSNRLAKINSVGDLDTTFDTTVGPNESLSRLRALYFYRTSAGIVDDTSVYLLNGGYFSNTELKSIIENKWFLYTLTMDSIGVLRVYMNNELMTSQILSTALARNLSFNRVGISASNVSPFKGNMSSLYCYNRTLSSGETEFNYSRNVNRYLGTVLTDYEQRVSNDSGTTINIDKSKFYTEYFKLISANPDILTFPYGYKASKLYSLLPSSGIGDYTFSRNGSGTYFNENGQLVVAPANVPRQYYDPFTRTYKGVLVERQSTNSFLNTITFSNSTWIYSSTQQITDDLFLLNSGKNLKVLVNDNITSFASSLCIRQSQTNIIKVGANSLSFFVKKTSPHSSIGVWGYTVTGALNVNFDVDTLTVTRPITFSGYTSRSGGVVPLGNNLFYCYERFTSNVNLSPSIGFSPTSSGSNSMIAGQEISIAGIQMENTDFPTSFIPTSGSTVTRPGDEIQSPLFNYNTSTYTVFFDIEYLDDYVSNTGDVSAEPLIWYFRRLNSSAVNFWNQNAQQNLGSFSFSPANSVKRFKGILKFDGTRISTFVNGTKVGNNITPTNLTPFLTYFSSNQYRLISRKVNLTGALDSSHVIKSFAVFPELLSDEMSTYLTTIF